MRICNLLLTSAIVLVWLSACGVAQDNGIFSGQGVRFPESKPVVEKKSKWPKLLDFSKDEHAQPAAKPFSGMMAKKPTFQMPKFEKPNFDLFKKKDDGLDSQKQPKPFSGFSDLFPKRDPNRPNVFEQMNAKSKEFIDRTTGWTKRKDQKLRDKKFETWNAITRDMRKIQANSNRQTAPAQPPVRTAEAPGKSGIRF